MKVYIYSIIFDEVNCSSFECATISTRTDTMIFATIKDAEDMAQILANEGHVVICSSSVDDWFIAWEKLIVELVVDK